MCGHMATTKHLHARSIVSRRGAWAQLGTLAMELSIREVTARGERVVVTKHGRPFVELISAKTASGMDFDRAAIVCRKLGLDGIKVNVPPDFDDPAFSRQVLGLED